MSRGEAKPLKGEARRLADFFPSGRRPDAGPGTRRQRSDTNPGPGTRRHGRENREDGAPSAHEPIVVGGKIRTTVREQRKALAIMEQHARRQRKKRKTDGDGDGDDGDDGDDETKDDASPRSAPLAVDVASPTAALFARSSSASASSSVSLSESAPSAVTSPSSSVAASVSSALSSEPAESAESAEQPTGTPAGTLVGTPGALSPRAMTDSRTFAFCQAFSPLPPTLPVGLLEAGSPVLTLAPTSFAVHQCTQEEDAATIRDLREQIQNLDIAIGAIHQESCDKDAEIQQCRERDARARADAAEVAEVAKVAALTARLDRASADFAAASEELRLARRNEALIREDLRVAHIVLAASHRREADAKRFLDTRDEHVRGMAAGYEAAAAKLRQQNQELADDARAHESRARDAEARADASDRWCRQRCAALEREVEARDAQIETLRRAPAPPVPPARGREASSRESGDREARVREARDREARYR